MGQVYSYQSRNTAIATQNSIYNYYRNHANLKYEVFTNKNNKDINGKKFSSSLRAKLQDLYKQGHKQEVIRMLMQVKHGISTRPRIQQKTSQKQHRTQTRDSFSSSSPKSSTKSTSTLSRSERYRREKTAQNKIKAEHEKLFGKYYWNINNELKDLPRDLHSKFYNEYKNIYQEQVRQRRRSPKNAQIYARRELAKAIMNAKESGKTFGREHETAHERLRSLSGHANTFYNARKKREDIGARLSIGDQITGEIISPKYARKLQQQGKSVMQVEFRNLKGNKQKAWMSFWQKDFNPMLGRESGLKKTIAEMQEKRFQKGYGFADNYGTQYKVTQGIDLTKLNNRYKKLLNK